MNGDGFGADYDRLREACLADPDEQIEQLVPSQIMTQSCRETTVGQLLALAKRFSDEPEPFFLISAARLVAIADNLLAYSTYSRNIKLRKEIGPAIDYIFDQCRREVDNPQFSIEVACAMHREFESYRVEEQDCPRAEKLHTVITSQLKKLETGCVDVMRNYIDHPARADEIIDAYSKVLIDYLKDPEIKALSALWTVFSDSYTRGNMALEKNGYFDTAQRIDLGLATKLPSSWMLTRLAADNFARHTDMIVDWLIAHPHDNEQHMNWSAASECMTKVRRQLEATYPYFNRVFEAVDRRFQEARSQYAVPAARLGRPANTYPVMVETAPRAG